MTTIATLPATAEVRVYFDGVYDGCIDVQALDSEEFGPMTPHPVHIWHLREQLPTAELRFYDRRHPALQDHYTAALSGLYRVEDYVFTGPNQALGWRNCANSSQRRR